MKPLTKNIINSISKQYGFWSIIEFSKWAIYYNRTKNKNAYFPLVKAKCVCGKIKDVRLDNIINGKSKNCGCIKEKYRKPTGNYERAYRIWTAMKTRCYNKNSINYCNYGARGIIMCDMWLGKKGFINFFNDMGEPPKNYSIDRIDNNGNYKPTNCRWADRLTQNSNTRSNRYIHIGDEKLTTKAAERKLGLRKGSLQQRIKGYGYTPEEAINLPKHGKKLKRFEYDGETKTLEQWSETTGILKQTLWYRLKRGWTIKEALTIRILNPKERKNKIEHESL